MEKYILELISENNRVIIPNFGAFIVSKEHGASILFNNFLSFNDGLLVNYIAEKKGIDAITATDQVFEYVDILKKQLDETGTYNINKLGSFKKDDNGILRFQQAEDFADMLNKESVPKDEKATENTEAEVKEESAEEPEKKVFVLDVDKPENKSKEEFLDNKKEGVKETWDKPNQEKKVIVPPAVTAPISEKTEEKKVQLKKPEPVSENKKGNGNKGLVLFLIVAAIIIIGLGAFFLLIKKPKTEKPKVVKKEIVKPVPVKPVVKDTVTVKPPVKKVPEVEKTITSGVPPMKGQIHIIVGGFSEVTNAKNMVDKLKGQGYTKAQVITKGKMFLVSIDSNISYSKVEARQQEILEQKIESWLYTIK
ncbi:MULTISPECIES: SPOR domain-containing protein [unclassified Saccharicrinis]|uniref:SPOR domain-containing protein n=1 Tax=unclassified Saccharicrinis TaxID=2646859 RepID=UPI003D3327CD